MQVILTEEEYLLLRKNATAGEQIVNSKMEALRHQLKIRIAREFGNHFPGHRDTSFAISFHRFLDEAFKD